MSAGRSDVRERWDTHLILYTNPGGVVAWVRACWQMRTRHCSPERSRYMRVHPFCQRFIVIGAGASSACYGYIAPPTRGAAIPIDGKGRKRKHRRGREVIVLSFCMTTIDVYTVSGRSIKHSLPTESDRKKADMSTHLVHPGRPWSQTAQGMATRMRHRSRVNYDNNRPVPFGKGSGTVAPWHWELNVVQLSLSMRSARWS